MKKYIVATAAMMLLAAPAAQAQDSYLSGFSFSLLGGWSAHPDLAIGGGHSPVNDGFNVGGRIEHSLGGSLSDFAVSADVLHNEADFGGAASGVRLNSTSYMGNLIYYLPTDSNFRFYGGGGLGAVTANLDGTAHGTSTVFGWQALGGVEMPMNDSTSLIAEYRYQNAHNANVAGTAIGNTSNNVSVGVKFRL